VLLHDNKKRKPTFGSLSTTTPAKRHRNILKKKLERYYKVDFKIIDMTKLPLTTL